jgi:diguanylate cyclase (GGDEF)-like protein
VLAHAVAHVPGADAGSVIVRGVDGNYRVEAAQGYDLEVLRRIVLAPAEVGGRGATERRTRDGGHRDAPPHGRQTAGAAVRRRRGRDCAARCAYRSSVHGEIAALLHLDATERPDAFDDDAVESGTLIGGLLGALLQRLSLESELKSERSKLDHMAHHDPLTGLPNRILLGDRLAHALERDRRSGHATALLVVDLDGFKSVNDTFGHATGDRLLAVLGSRLREALRTEDTVARIGGDEFAVVASGLVDPAAARVIAQKVAAAFDAPIDVAGRVVGIGGSIGVSIAPQDGDDAGTLLKNADLAMYRVKREGRGAIAFFTHDLDARMRARTLLTEDLRAALQAGELHLAYQVRVRLGDGSAVGVEAFARWDHPCRGRGATERVRPPRGGSRFRGAAGAPRARPRLRGDGGMAAARAAPRRGGWPSTSRRTSSGRAGSRRWCATPWHGTACPPPHSIWRSRRAPCSTSAHRCWSRCNACARLACGWRWTTSGPATPPSTGWPCSRSTP